MKHRSNYTLRFPRTASEAFRDADYGRPFEHHLGPAWRRLIRKALHALARVSIPFTLR